MTSRLEVMRTGGNEIAEWSAPSEAERSTLLARLHEVTALEAPASEAEIGKRVNALLLGFSDGGQDARNYAAKVQLIVSGLIVFPLWAIDEMCRRFRDGTAGVKTAFAPNVAQLISLCREIVQPVRNERARIKSVLDARVYRLADWEERERVTHLVTEFQAEMRERDEKQRGGQGGTPRHEFAAVSDALNTRDLASYGIHDGHKASVPLRKQIAEHMGRPGHIAFFPKKRV